MAYANDQQRVKCIIDEGECLLWKQMTRRLIEGNKEELEEDEYIVWRAQMEDVDKVGKILFQHLSL
jgi:hypothetical protein